MKTPVLCMLLSAAMPAWAAGERPNVVFILADDLGGSDLGATGSTFYQTPNIDLLATEGVLFRQAYSACTVCSPTRASLLTGKSPAELRLTDWIPGQEQPFAKLKIPAWTKLLDPGETTLADYFKKAGYATAIIGKWHLGDVPPTEYGFDLNIGGTAAGHPHSYFSPYYSNPALPNGPPGEFLSDRLTDEAIKWIEANKARPFFLYLSHFAVHTPIMGKPEVIEKYKPLVKEGAPQKNPVYAALVESVDDSVGRVRAKLQELGLADKTIVVFTSDNGGLLPVTQNLGMRGGKGSPYEGGVRVPLIISWPGTIKPGTLADPPAITGDHLYTLLDLIGAPIQAPPEYRSLAPALLRREPITPRDFFWHYPHYDKRGRGPYSAIRSGDYKLIEFFDPPHLELYDLRNDPMEQKNLENAGLAAELKKKLGDWRARVHAQMPEPNPDYDPARAKKTAPSADKSAE